MSVVLRPISPSAAEALLAGRVPDDVRVASDCPTEFSVGIAPSVGGTDAVHALVRRAREVPEIKRIVAHTPLDRPASGRVLDKAGFTLVGETDDEHEGTAVRVHRWELTL